MMKLDKNLLEQVQEIKNKDDVQDLTKDALKSLDLANNIIESIMTGKQIDLAFYSLYSKAHMKKIKGKK